MTEEYVPNKEQHETEEELSKVLVSNLLNKKINVVIIKMLNELGRMDENSEELNKELENIKKNQTDLKNTITEIKIH